MRHAGMPSRSWLPLGVEQQKKVFSYRQHEPHQDKACKNIGLGSEVR